MNWQERPLGTLKLPTAVHTHNLGKCLANILLPGDTLLLEGDLGTGKTTLARALIQTLVPAVQAVESPTFNMVHLYDQTHIPIWHADLYRLNSPEDWHELGLEETSEGIKVIEWPEKAAHYMSPKALLIHLQDQSRGRRALFYGMPDWNQRLNFFITEGSL
jgi:tRNA threonylcarbamoyladenosine biosynthesis protein TsaE